MTSTRSKDDPYLITDVVSKAEGDELAGAGRVEERAPSVALPRQFESLITITYDYSTHTVATADLRVPLVVLVREYALNSASHEEAAGSQGQWMLNPARECTFQLLVEPWPIIGIDRDRDVSGVLGLLSPWGLPTDSKQHSAFERTLADVQMWALYKARTWMRESRKSGLIILQGPLLPKLRGRLYYRMLDPVATPIFVVTSDPAWAMRLISPLRLRVDEAPSQESWVGPLPDPTLDAGTRSFVYFSLTGMVHVSIPANMLAPGDARDFWRQCGDDLRHLFRRGVQPCPMHKNVCLPAPFADAISRARSVVEPLCDRVYAADFIIRYLNDPSTATLDDEVRDAVAKVIGASPLKKAAKGNPMAPGSRSEVLEKLNDGARFAALDKLGRILRQNA